MPNLHIDGNLDLTGSLKVNEKDVAFKDDIPSGILSEDLALREFGTLVPKGTNIPENANLNTIDYLKVGNYACTGDAAAKKLTNCPTVYAFMMQVICPNSKTYDDESTKNWRYRLRIITDRIGDVYYQSSHSAGTAGAFIYSAWKKAIMSNGGTFTGKIVSEKGTGVQFNTASGKSYTLYGDGAGSSDELWMLQYLDAENYQYYRFMDANGNLYSNNKQVFTTAGGTLENDLIVHGTTSVMALHSYSPQTFVGAKNWTISVDGDGNLVFE